jgi:hypothetical protein
MSTKFLWGFHSTWFLNRFLQHSTTGFLYVKSTVFLSPVARIGDMNNCITDAIMTLQADMLIRTWEELEYLLDIVPATEIPHTEVY